MGKGGGQVFSGPEPVQTPPQMSENITPEAQALVRSLKDDRRLDSFATYQRLVVVTRDAEVERLEMNGSIAFEELEIRQLKEAQALDRQLKVDKHLDAFVTGFFVVTRDAEGGWSNRSDGMRHAHEDRVNVRCIINSDGSSLPQIARATAFHARLSESPPRSRVNE